MNREYHKWYSPRLNRDMELLLFGHAGRPVIAFPTSMARFYEYEDFSMIGTLAERFNNGQLQMVCVDSLDLEAFYNRSVPAFVRAARHAQWEDYLIHEVLPFFRSRNDRVNWELNVTGASFGALHAANFGFRHPDIVRRIVAMSGAYSLKFLMHGDFGTEIYLNSPIDYVPNLQDDWFLSRMRQQDIVLAAGSEDICLGSTRHLSEVLWAKAVPNYLDIWGGAWHDWPWWKLMALKFF